ncbi:MULTISPECIES: hypothetical protein [unclassified Actinomyces]|uniref:hypothetical protein n=1 Tax=unclassified Actinomyces TaxID=2609248 RepID=UPI0020182483|nr:MULTISPECIES: hypothetical protein [unclassified Actinomyces]
MHPTTYYDVTTWPHGDPYDDIGAVINDMVADIKTRQHDPDTGSGGKPGAVIVIPPGDYRLRTQERIDISFLRIQGAGHGFTSSSIRFNVPREEWAGLHELWPGGSRVMVDLPVAPAGEPADAAAFRIIRQGSPRISSVELVGFCIDACTSTTTAPPPTRRTPTSTARPASTSRTPTTPSRSREWAWCTSSTR